MTVEKRKAYAGFRARSICSIAKIKPDRLRTWHSRGVFADPPGHRGPAWRGYSEAEAVRIFLLAELLRLDVATASAATISAAILQRTSMRELLSEAQAFIVGSAPGSALSEAFTISFQPPPAAIGSGYIVLDLRRLRAMHAALLRDQ